MSTTVRNALSSDLPAITAIYRESVLNGVASYELTPPSLEEMTARYTALVGQDYPYVVAVDEAGTIQGYAYAGAYRTRPAYRWTVEDSIYLPPELRGRGIGRALLAELIARCTALGFRQMVAVIGGASPASIALHAALGFELTGTMKSTGFKHGRWRDTTIMQRALGQGSDTDPDMETYPGTLFRE